MSIIAPNIVAVLALVAWPLVPFFLYRLSPLVPATLWSILAAQLLLPVGAFFKFDMVPLLDKNSISCLTTLVGCMIVGRRPVRLWSQDRVTGILVFAYLGCPIITSLLNGDPILIGDKVLPGVGIYDGLSALLSQFVALLPFFLGRQFVRGTNDPQRILTVLALAGLAYSVLLLFEIRFSPQLHFWLYGYYPSDFIQEIREGGTFRPMVFMGHGLIASFFAMTAVVASAALWRTRNRLLGLNAGGFTFYLAFVLYLCKSSAALVYGLALTPLVRWTAPRTQMLVAVLLVSLALLYPLLRITEVFPTRALVDVFQTIDTSRAHSLEYRFDQEEELIERAAQRPVFGWGRFGRSRVFKEDWQGAGVDASVTDGRWIITFGQFGILGFLAEFGLLAMPVFRALSALRFVKNFHESVFLAATALIVAINMIDLLPNSALSPWTWLLAGALLGCSESLLADARIGVRRGNVSFRYS